MSYQNSYPLPIFSSIRPGASILEHPPTSIHPRKANQLYDLQKARDSLTRGIVDAGLLGNSNFIGLSSIRFKTLIVFIIGMTSKVHILHQVTCMKQVSLLYRFIGEIFQFEMFLVPVCTPKSNHLNIGKFVIQKCNKRQHVAADFQRTEKQFIFLQPSELT